MNHPLATALLALAAASPLADAVAPGDPVRGEALYARCLGCHALTYHRTGPMHCGLFGRRAGSLAGFPYSTAMATTDVVWTDSTLNRFLANPNRMFPGTTMGYAGIPDAQERSDLIAWLREANKSPSECTP